ncbi:MAG: IS21 family transposase, partial [Burkholderiaceae bacterium]
FLEHWETKWAAPRIHGSTRRQVEAMYQEERPYLKALPVAPMQYFKETQRTVCDDTCIRVDHSGYAARPARIGSRVLVRLFEHHIEIRDIKTQALLRTHTRVDRPGTVVLPERERLFNPSRETHALLRQAEEIGAGAHQLCQALFANEGRVGQRKLWGIVGLARRYPRRLVDQACHSALAEGIHSYKLVKALTEQLTAQALEHLDAPVQPELALTQRHRLIRDGQDYADLFTLGAQQSARLPLTDKDRH